MVQQREPDLAQVVRARGTAGRLARRLDRRQQQRHERADDGDDHQELDERKRDAMLAHHEFEVRRARRSLDPAQSSMHCNDVPQSPAQVERSGAAYLCKLTPATVFVPRERLPTNALVGLLTSELNRPGLLAVAGKLLAATMALIERPIRQRSVTAAGPSRNCTGVPCCASAEPEASGRPPTHESRSIYPGAPSGCKRPFRTTNRCGFDPSEKLGTTVAL